MTKRGLILLLVISFMISCKSEEKEEEKIRKDAFTELNDQIAADSSHADLYFRRAKIFLEKENLKQAFEDASNAVRLDSNQFDYLMLFADISFKGLQIAKAVQSFERAAQIKPDNIDVHLRLSELFLYLKAYPRTIAEANEALRIDKNNAKAYFLKGFAYKESGDTAKAISGFQTATEMKADYYDAYIQLGNIYSTRNSRLAPEYYTNALRYRPGSTEALYNRGLFFQNTGQLELAVADYQNILKIDSGYSDAYFNLGYIEMIFKENCNTAKEYFSKAIRVNSQFAEAYFNRGLCYEMEGKKEAALEDFKKALDIAPKYKLAEEGIKRLN